MEGLEKILDAIAADAQKQSDEIVEEANNQAKAIKKESDDLSTAEYNSVVGKANERANRIIESADSFSEIDFRNKILSEKRVMIDRVFDKAVEKLVNLPDDKYLAVITALVKKYADNGEGELIFNSKDLKKATPSFVDALNKSLTSGKSVVISEKADDSIVGGFRIRYGNIEVNCAFDALCNEYRETATTNVAKILFD